MTGERALVGILDWEEVGRIPCRGEKDDHSKPWEETLRFPFVPIRSGPWLGGGLGLIRGELRCGIRELECGVEKQAGGVSPDVGGNNIEVLA